MTMMPDADMEFPYEGAKEMLLVDHVENRSNCFFKWLIWVLALSIFMG
jgi:hypothetical protein